MTPPTDNDTVLVWDQPVRVIHWLLVLAVAGAWFTSDDDGARSLHLLFGYSALGLLLFRLLWGVIGSRHARFAQFLRGPAAVVRYLRALFSGHPEPSTGHNPAGAVAVLLLLALGLGTTITGALMATGIVGESLEEVHELLANSLLVMIGIHVAGVIVSSVLHRENLARAMLTGRKRGRQGDGITRRSTAVAVAIVIALAGFWAYGLGVGRLPLGLDAGIERSDGAGDGDFD